MNTALVCSTWLDTTDYLAKTLKFLDYYTQPGIMDALNINSTDIWLVDNASDEKLLEWVKNKYNVSVYRYKKHLPRTGHLEYPYCWRGLKWIQNYVKNNNVNKIIFLDTDFFVLSGKLSDYIKELNSGWVSFYCKRHNFPEAAFHICCQDNLEKLLFIDVPSYTHYNNQHMEYILPFTYINKTEFVGDRYGEFGKKQEPDMDYYGQWHPSLEELKFYD